MREGLGFVRGDRVRVTNDYQALSAACRENEGVADDSRIRYCVGQIVTIQSIYTGKRCVTINFDVLMGPERYQSASIPAEFAKKVDEGTSSSSAAPAPAPPPAPAPAPSWGGGGGGGGGGGAGDETQLPLSETLSGAELRRRCGEANVPTYGAREQMVARIRGAAATALEPEATSASKQRASDRAPPAMKAADRGLGDGLERRVFVPFGFLISLFVQTCTPPQVYKTAGSLPISYGFAGPRMIAQGAFKPSPFTKKQE